MQRDRVKRIVSLNVLVVFEIVGKRTNFLARLQIYFGLRILVTCLRVVRKSCLILDGPVSYITPR